VERAASFRDFITRLEGNQCTAVQCEVRLSGAPERHVPVTLSAGSMGSYPFSGLGLLAIVIGDGISLKGRGGNVAPGCETLGPGLAVPRRDGAYDHAALRACARRVKDSAAEFAGERTVVVAAGPDVPFLDVLNAIDALRGAKLDLFPDVTLLRSWSVGSR
jgi:hypothetical protein